jgi:hypothetical protein
VVTGRRVELHGFPHERIVRAKAMMAGWNVTCDALSEEQCRERLAVERQHDLPCPYVTCGGAFHGQSGACLRCWCQDRIPFNPVF